MITCSMTAIGGEGMNEITTDCEEVTAVLEEDPTICWMALKVNSQLAGAGAVCSGSVYAGTKRRAEFTAIPLDAQA
jgi:hypothetical protein